MTRQDDNAGRQDEPAGGDRFATANFEWVKDLLPRRFHSLALATLRWGAENIRLVFIILVTVAALPYCVFPISVNAQRIAQLSLTEGTIQRGLSELGRIVKDDPQVAVIRGEISAAERRRSSLLGQIGYGKGPCSETGAADCLKPSSGSWWFQMVGSDRFQARSSEQNNILLSMACGILGAVLAIVSKAFVNSSSFLFRNAVCQLLTGATVGLLALYVLKGLKGPPLLTIAETVDVNGPYGVALTCTLAGLFSDDFIVALRGVFHRLAAKLALPGEAGEGGKVAKPDDRGLNGGKGDLSGNGKASGA